MTIKRITKAYTRTYSDNKQTTTYVEWIDSGGQPGRTEGRPDNPLMKALLARANREGVPVQTERW